jgi:ketosteroid isomerase-like protein
VKGFSLKTLFDPEVELFNIRESPLPEPYRGYGGLRQWREGVFEVLEDGRFEIDDLIDVDEANLVVYKMRLVGRARHTGIAFQRGWTTVQWIRDGRIYRSESYTDQAEAFEAAGLSE